MIIQEKNIYILSLLHMPFIAHNGNVMYPTPTITIYAEIPTEVVLGNMNLNDQIVAISSESYPVICYYSKTVGGFIDSEKFNSQSNKDKKEVIMSIFNAAGPGNKLYPIGTLAESATIAADTREEAINLFKELYVNNTLSEIGIKPNLFNKISNSRGQIKFEQAKSLLKSND